MRIKNFILINGSDKKTFCYLISTAEDGFHFWRYENGIRYPVCSIADCENRLLYFCVDEKNDIQFSSIEYPTVIVRKPDGTPLPVHQKNQLEVITESGNMFIVRNKNYPDLPVSNAMIYFKKEEDEELRLLSTVYIEAKTGELKIDFI